METTLQQGWYPSLIGITNEPRHDKKLAQSLGAPKPNPQIQNQKPLNVEPRHQNPLAQQTQPAPGLKHADIGAWIGFWGPVYHIKENSTGNYLGPHIKFGIYVSGFKLLGFTTPVSDHKGSVAPATMMLFFLKLSFIRAAGLYNLKASGSNKNIHLHSSLLCFPCICPEKNALGC